MTRVALFLLLLGCGAGTRSVAPITLEPILTIGTDSGAAALPNWAQISPRHPRGFRIVIPQLSEGDAIPLVFDDQGALIGPLDNSGQKSSLFTHARFARFGPGDSIWIFDGSKKAFVFGPDRRLGRTVSLPIEPWDAQVLANGRLVVSPVFAASPILLLDSLGTEIAELVDSIAIPSLRRVFLGPGGMIWTLAMQYRWRVEQWDSNGSRIQTITHEPTWFTPYQTFNGPSGDRAPSPSLVDGWFDAKGRLWLLGKSADPAWQRGLGHGTGDQAGAVIREADRVYDSVIEVLDPRTGAITAEARFDVSYPFAVEPGIVGRVVDLPNGRKQVVLMRVQLNDKP